MARTVRQHRLLFGVLLLLGAMLALAQLAGLVAIHAGRVSGWSVTASQIRALEAPLFCASPLLAGLLIDRFGVRRVVALGLVAWCGLVTAGTAVLPPLALAAIQPLVFALLRGLILTACLVALRASLPPRRRAPTIAVLLIAYDIATTPSLALSWLALGLAGSDTVLFGTATLGALIVAAWLLVPFDIDRDGGPNPDHQPSEGVGPLPAQRIVWSLIVIQLCHGAVSSLVLDRTWTFKLVRQGAIGGEVLVPIIVAPVALLVAANWSDWGLRRTRALARSRLPFIVLGLVAVAISGLAGTRPQASAVGMAALAAIGVGASRMVDILAVDLAPRAAAGRFIGLIGAAQVFSALYVAPILTTASDDPQAKVPVLVTTSVAGAVLALVLLWRMPDAPTP